MGFFDRSVKGNDADGGSLFYFSGTHAQAINDRWAFNATLSVADQVCGKVERSATPAPPGPRNCGQSIGSAAHVDTTTTRHISDNSGVRISHRS